jgi:hypothetical protein
MQKAHTYAREMRNENIILDGNTEDKMRRSSSVDISRGCELAARSSIPGRDQ